MFDAGVLLLFLRVWCWLLRVRYVKNPDKYITGSAPSDYHCWRLVRLHLLVEAIHPRIKQLPINPNWNHAQVAEAPTPDANLDDLPRN